MTKLGSIADVLADVRANHANPADYRRSYYRRTRLKICAREGVTAISLGGYTAPRGFREWITYRKARA